MPNIYREGLSYYRNIPTRFFWSCLVVSTSPNRLLYRSLLQWNLALTMFGSSVYPGAVAGKATQLRVQCTRAFSRRLAPCLHEQKGFIVLWMDFRVEVVGGMLPPPQTPLLLRARAVASPQPADTCPLASPWGVDYSSAAPHLKGEDWRHTGSHLNLCKFGK